MALDLSTVRFGSKEVSTQDYMSAAEIMAEAERLKQVKSDAKYIAIEIMKELDKREEKKKESEIETAETVPETVPAETVAVVEVSDPVDYSLPIVTGSCGFLIGVLLTSLCFVIKLNQIRRESEKW